MSFKPARPDEFEEELQQPLQADSGSSGELRPSTSLLWLKLGRESYLEIAPNATDMLRKERGYINMVMVCGNVRTGKSYLMNALLDRRVFGVSDRATSFTAGVEICPYLVPMSQFGGHENSSTPKIAFVDMEGHGDKGIKQDVKLATPLLMISKAVILNEICPTGPAREVILGKLEVLMYAAQTVASRRERRGLFGCLHIILRDCSQSEEEMNHLIFAEEDDFAADTEEQEQAIRKRNVIRSAIRLSFESFRVWCLPKILAITAPPCYRDAGDAYAEKVDALRQELASQLSTPKMVNECGLTGSAIATLLPQVAEEIRNEHPALSPPSLMECVIEAEAVMIADELMQRARSELETGVRKRLPVDPAELLEIASMIKNRLTDKPEWPFGERARAPILEKFEVKFNAELAELRVQNTEQLNKLLREVEQELTSRVSDLLRKIELPLEPACLTDEMERIRGNLNEELKNRLRVAPATEREAVQQRIADMALPIETEMHQRNLDSIIDRVERDVTRGAQEKLEALTLPQQTDRLHDFTREIRSEMLFKLTEKLPMVPEEQLDSVKHRVLDRIRLVEESLQARNKEKLSGLLREAETEHESKTKEHLDALRLPLRDESLRKKINLLKGSSSENLEERLRIAHPEEAHGVRQRLEMKWQKLEEDIFSRNSSSLLQKAKETEEETVAKFKSRIEAVPLPEREEQLKKRVDRIRARLLSDVDLSIHPEREAEEIRQRIETQLQALECELMTRNQHQLWRRRWRVAFKAFWLFVFLLAVTLTMDVMKVISLKSISCTLATGTEHALATMWSAPASIIGLREKLCIDEEVPEDPREDNDPGRVEDEERLRLAKEAEEAWKAAEEEAKALAKWLNRKEMLRWLPYGTGVGIVGVAMCLWSRL